MTDDPYDLARFVAAQDALVHLGGIPLEDTWENLLTNNIDGTYKVLRASHEVGIGRVVLASSIHAAGYDSVWKSCACASPHDSQNPRTNGCSAPGFRPPTPPGSCSPPSRAHWREASNRYGAYPPTRAGISASKRDTVSVTTLSTMPSHTPRRFSRRRGTGRTNGPLGSSRWEEFSARSIRPAWTTGKPSSEIWRNRQKRE